MPVATINKSVLLDALRIALPRQRNSFEVLDIDVVMHSLQRLARFGMMSLAPGLIAQIAYSGHTRFAVFRPYEFCEETEWRYWVGFVGVRERVAFAAPFDFSLGATLVNGPEAWATSLLVQCDMVLGVASREQERLVV